jgi:hypothetical protein
MGRPTAKAKDLAKRRVERHLIRWKPLVGLAPWKIHHRYYRREKDIPKKHRRAAMWCAVDYEYLVATVYVALNRIAHETSDEIEAMVRHELLHATINEMRCWQVCPTRHAMDHEERTVSTLTAAFLWTYNAGWNDGKKHLRKLQARRAARKGVVTIGGKEYRLTPLGAEEGKPT